MRALLIAAAALAFALAPARAGDDLLPVRAFVDVTVISVYGRPHRPHQTVLVRGDRIIFSGPSRRAPLPQDAEILNRPGQIIAPGLADMHVHIFNPDDGILFLANGVTTVRNMSGRDDANALAERIDRGVTPGPTIYSSGPIINGPGTDWGAVATTPAEMRALIAGQARAGYIAVKLYETLPPALFSAGVSEARARGLQIYAHVPLSMSLDQVLSLRIDSIEHLTGFDRALSARPADGWDEARWAEADIRRIGPLARAVARSGVWNDATLVTLVDAPCSFADIAAAEASPDYRYASPRQRALWRSQYEEVRSQRDVREACAMAQRAHRIRLMMIRALRRAHAPLLIGSDAPQPFVYPGISLQRELGYHLDAGLTRAEILRIASYDAAHFLRRQGEFGEVKAGARADLLLLDGDPELGFEPLGRPAGVMAAGRWYNEETLMGLLEEAAQRAHGPAEH
ncbi:MAG: amidohydrolase family protein [Hyphomonadaceae bacterium]